MSPMYASSSSQKTSLLVLRKPADALVELPRRHRAAAAGGAAEQPDAVLLDERVLVRADVMPVTRREVVRIVLEVGGEKADRPGVA